MDRNWGLLSVLILLAAASASAQTPVIAPQGVLNGGSFDKTGQPLAPGALISIFGSDLSAATASASTIPLSTDLSGVQVTFNGVKAPLKDVVHGSSFDQINAQIPFEVLPAGTQNGTAQVIVTRNGVISAPQSVTIGPAAPGIFAIPGGVGQAVAYGNTDGAIAAPSNAGLPFASHPAKIGDPTTLVILCTGLGMVDPPVTTGGIVTDGQIHRAVITPQVLVGQVPAQVVFAGMTPQFVGVYQINIIIQPGTPTGNAIPLQIVSNGVTSRADVTIAVTQ
jgi:uncharacterized protein (TIGR03437 family)